ncbi:MAG: helix-turn-helix domain-containing protein [Deltaproteobacteria bacterium]|nr:helix-turn-helix domain-containing protein [Deltaproteobacteria bacterium]
MSKVRDVDVMALEIGGKIKNLRLEKNYTLQDLTDKTGLSKPLISQIENNRVVPPVATLLKLARALDVGLGYFFQDKETKDRVVLTRKSERKTVSRQHHYKKDEVGYTYSSLEVKKARKHMEPFWVMFEVTETKDMRFFSHDGEEFVYLFSGRLEFRTKDQVLVLEPGDALYFESDISHAFRALSQEPAQALIVVYHQD